MGGIEMNITYNSNTDLLYIRIDEKKQDMVNRQVSPGIVVDIGDNEKIVGIEFLDASKHLNLEHLLPVNFQHAA
jgi:uncharacterized protein YuzE